MTVRYGKTSTDQQGVDTSSYVFYTTQGVQNVPCSAIFGDPIPNTQKTCAYTVTDIFGLGGLVWTGGNTGEGTFKQITGGPAWLRYGANGHWYYTVVGGSAAAGSPELIDCSNNGLTDGWDPAPGSSKQCQWSTSEPPAIETAFARLGEQATGGTSCSVDDGSCAVTTGQPILARYGASNAPGFGQSGNVSKFAYRFMRRGDNQFACNPSDGFGTDPWAGTPKSCQYAALDIARQSGTTTGQWTLVASCDSACSGIDSAIEIGTSKDDSWSTLKQWSNAVEISAEESFKIGEDGLKISQKYTHEWLNNETTAGALTRSGSQTVTVHCVLPPNHTRIVLYQFGMTTTANCLQNGVCQGVTTFENTYCAVDPPSGYSGPKCLPGYCDPKDPLCNRCVYR